MCGIVGCAGKINQSEERAFKTMLELDTIRGSHSTGVGRVDKKGDPDYYKVAGTPWDMYEYKDFHTMFNKVHTVLLGHNRYATKGAINSENAHPFIHDREDAEGRSISSVMGVHNGTLFNQSDLKDYKDFEVDSDNLYYDMSVNGMAKTLATIRGAFALVWFDSADRTINFCRNNERPLYYTTSEDNKTIFWASEPWMLSIALSKASIKFHEIKSVEVEKHYSIHIPASMEKTDIDVKIESVAFFRFPVYENTYKKGSAWDLWKDDEDTKRPTNNVTNITPASRKSMANISRTYMNKEVVFSVVGAQTINKAEFILAEIENDVNVYKPVVRLYVMKDTRLYDKLIRSVTYFKGKVKGIASYGDSAYITIDYRTIKEVPLPALEFDKPEDIIADEIDKGCLATFPGPGGKMFTFEKWSELTKKGCGFCSEAPELSEAGKVVWIPHTSDFFCESCSTSQLAVDYMYSSRNG